MGEAATKQEWIIQSFLAWLADGHGGEHRWELVDGEPTMMAPPVARHSIVVGNVNRMLANALRGGPCRPFTGNFGVETRRDQYRLPDVMVDCGPRDMGDAMARDPKLVVEVLSPSTRVFDTIGKLEGYRGVPGLVHLVVIDPAQVNIALWTRTNGDWAYQLLTEPDAALHLSAFDVALPLAEIYEDVTFED